MQVDSLLALHTLKVELALLGGGLDLAMVRLLGGLVVVLSFTHLVKEG
jgi:hypothetical protein